MSGPQRELAQQDRWRIIGGWLHRERTRAGRTQQDLTAGLTPEVSVRRLHLLENGMGEPTEAELGALVAALGSSRADLDAHVQDQLLMLLLGSPSEPVGLPTIVIVPPTEPQGEPLDGLLTLVRLYQEPSAADAGEVTLSGRAVESLAARRGLTGLECWQLLARFIPGDRLD